MHVLQHFELRADPDFRKSRKYQNMPKFQIPKAFFFELIFQNIFRQTFSSKLDLKNVRIFLMISVLDQNLQLGT